MNPPLQKLGPSPTHGDVARLQPDAPPIGDRQAGNAERTPDVTLEAADLESTKPADRRPGHGARHQLAAERGERKQANGPRKEAEQSNEGEDAIADRDGARRPANVRSARRWVGGGHGFRSSGRC